MKLQKSLLQQRTLLLLAVVGGSFAMTGCDEEIEDRRVVTSRGYYDGPRSSRVVVRDGYRDDRYVTGSRRTVVRDGYNDGYRSTRTNRVVVRDGYGDDGYGSTTNRVVVRDRSGYGPTTRVRRSSYYGDGSDRTVIRDDAPVTRSRSVYYR